MPSVIYHIRNERQVVDVDEDKKVKVRDDDEDYGENMVAVYIFNVNFHDRQNMCITYNFSKTF